MFGADRKWPTEGQTDVIGPRRFLPRPQYRRGQRYIEELTEPQGLRVIDRVPVQAPIMFLGEGKQAHDHQSRQDKSGYEVLHHGYHSTGLAHYVVGDRAAKDDEHRGRSRQRAARPIRARSTMSVLGGKADLALASPDF